MATAAENRPMSREEKKVILASSLGTIFEWYDFYLYGTLAVIIGNQFFSALDPASRTIFSLLAFAAGFLVRPNTNAPNGRTTKPAANASSEKMVREAGSSAEKNWLPMITASVPYK